MKLTKPLLSFHRSGLLTLPTVTYASMRRFGLALDYALEICLIGLKSKAKDIVKEYISLFIYIQREMPQRCWLRINLRVCNTTGRS